MPVPMNNDGKRPTDFSPPRAKGRPTLGLVDPPSENRARMQYPYGEDFPDDSA